jgi:hypothetical protein
VRPDALITREDALCIAKVSGLERGIAKWQVREYQDYVDVFNTTVRQPRARGMNVRMRRVGGSVMSVEPWNEVIVRDGAIEGSSPAARDVSGAKARGAHGRRGRTAQRLFGRCVSCV